jgi:hypothetical protein
MEFKGLLYEARNHFQGIGASTETGVCPNSPLHAACRRLESARGDYGSLLENKDFN